MPYLNRYFPDCRIEVEVLSGLLVVDIKLSSRPDPLCFHPVLPKLPYELVRHYALWIVHDYVSPINACCGPRAVVAAETEVWVENSRYAEALIGMNGHNSITFG